jgi:hypothetical protein
VSTATRRAIYGKLSGDTTLNNLLGTPATGYSKSIYYQIVPANAGFPFVVFQKQAGTPTQAFGSPSAMETEVWLVKGIDRDTTADDAEAIQARIMALLNDTTLTISGSTLQFLRRESDIDYSEVDDGVTYRHAGSLYRLVTS